MVPLVIYELKRVARSKVSRYSRSYFANRRGYIPTHRPKLRFSRLDQLPPVDRGTVRSNPAQGEHCSISCLAATVDKEALPYRQIAKSSTKCFTNNPFLLISLIIDFSFYVFLPSFLTFSTNFYAIFKDILNEFNYQVPLLIPKFVIEHQSRVLRIFLPKFLPILIVLLDAIQMILIYLQSLLPYQWFLRVEAR